MKKIILIVVVALLVALIVLSIPSKSELKDGGSVVYESITWRYEKVHSLNEYGGYDIGTRFEILGIKIIDNVKIDEAGIDPDYNYNTDFVLENTYWKDVTSQYTFQFNNPNTKNGFIKNTLNAQNNPTKGIYKIYTGTNLEKYKAKYDALDQNIKYAFERKTKSLNGQAFVLVIEEENPDGEQTHIEYYGIYHPARFVIIDTSSAETLIFNLTPMEVQ